jgi:hypothetical protein
MSDEAKVRVLARTVDPYGRVVVLNERGWAHILQEHEEMAAHRDAIMTTVSAPEHRQPDPLLGRERYYHRNLGPSRWLFVVVHCEETPARIVTAYANRKDPPGWTAQ